MTKIGCATAEQSLVDQRSVSYGRVAIGVFREQHSKEHKRTGLPSWLVPSAINRAHCGNAAESITILEDWAGSRYA